MRDVTMMEIKYLNEKLLKFLDAQFFNHDDII